MELKTKYQYTYFIHPYIIKANRYEKYLLRLLKDKKCSLRIFGKEKDLDMYSYFLPKIRDFMFPTFEFSKAKIKKLEEMDVRMQATILAKYPCMIFEYDLGGIAQGKAGEESGIFFKIEKVEIICFSTGVNFITFKTHIDDANRFDDILNFNYKFREIHSKLEPLKKFENIKIQTDRFEDVRKITDVIAEIEGPNVDTKDYNIESEKFLTYSYACIDQEAWNENNSFEEIEHEFLKYYNILPSSYNTSFNEQKTKENPQIISKWEYIRCGFSKRGSCLLASGIDTNNYTKLPFAYENEYLYTYLIFLYEKIYMKKLNAKNKNKKQLQKARKDFITFTQNLWSQDITNDDTGTLMCKKWKEALGVVRIYDRQKNKVDMLYKEMDIEKTEKVNKGIGIVLVISLVLNIISYILLFLK